MHFNFKCSKNIIHRNLNPGTIFIDEMNVLKIRDFAHARILLQDDTQLTHFHINSGYESPELMCRGYYNEKVDIFVAGTIMAELFLKKKLIKVTPHLSHTYFF